MKLKKLAEKSEGHAKCFLCSVGLSDYIKNIPEDYTTYSVQRGIVGNKYLDRLVDTVEAKGHIPPIVLVAERLEEKNDEVTLDDFSVLDGLQRTHRLKIIYDTVEFLIESAKDGLQENPARFCRKYTDQIRQLGSNSKLVKALVDYSAQELASPDEFFGDNQLWLEVWVGLDDAQQINKMLLLNAGHKSVNIKHQLELLFLDKLIDLKTLVGNEVKFVREKDISAIQYSKRRQRREFHFSHIISAIIALSAGKIVQTNSDFISSIQSDNVQGVELSESFDYKLLTLVMNLLISLDDSLTDLYNGMGIKWLGREVVLVGLFGALGSYAQEKNEDPHAVIQNFQESIADFSNKLNLQAFEEARNNVQLNKVNVGLVNKRAVFSAVTDYLKNGDMDEWQKYFGVLHNDI